MLTYGLTLYEEALYLYYGRELIFHFHHVLVVVMFSSILYYPHLIFFVCWAATVEATGLFVNYFLIDRKLNPKRTNIMAGVLMWLSFLIFRIISLPVCLIIVLLDALKEPRVISDLSLPYLLLNGCSALCVLLMSGFWFYKMTKGILKALKGGKEVAPAPKPVKEGAPVQEMSPLVASAGAGVDVEMAEAAKAVNNTDNVCIPVTTPAGESIADPVQSSVPTLGTSEKVVSVQSAVTAVPATAPVSILVPVPDLL
jgi:hypothetical protein